MAEVRSTAAQLVSAHCVCVCVCVCDTLPVLWCSGSVLHAILCVCVCAQFNYSVVVVIFPFCLDWL